MGRIFSKEFSVGMTKSRANGEDRSVREADHPHCRCCSALILPSTPTHVLSSGRRWGRPAVPCLTPCPVLPSRSHSLALCQAKAPSSGAQHSAPEKEQQGGQARARAAVPGRESLLSIRKTVRHSRWATPHLRTWNGGGVGSGGLPACWMCPRSGEVVR